MNHIKFLQAIAKRDYDGLLHDGGFDLTKEQLETVIRMSKEDSDLELQRKGAQVASNPGYREFMTTPIMSQVGGQTEGFGRIGKQTAVPEKQPKKKSEPKQTKRDNKDPNFNNVSPKSTQNLRVGDTEADVLGKFYNFLVRKSEFDNKRFAEAEKFRKEIDPLKNQRLEDIIAAFQGREAKQLKTKTEVKAPSKWKKMLGLGALGLGAMLLSNKTFAAINDLQLDKMFSIFPEVPDIASMEPGISEIENLGDAMDARKSAEKYLGRDMSDAEWDQLLRATSAEAGSNTTEQAMVMASILNRARTGGETITQVLYKPNQFQAVTGTKVSPGPSKNYLTPFEKIPQERQQSIMFGATNVLSGVDKNLKNFTAASSAAYGPGTNIGYRDEMLRKGGQTVGGTVFAAPAPAYAPNKPPQKLIGDVPTKQQWDELNERWNEIKDEDEKTKDEKVSIFNNTTNVLSGGTTYAWTLPHTNNTPALIDKVYNTYG